MKNLIVAITFAMLSLTLPLTMAQQVADVEPVAEVESNSETRVENDGKRIVIDINTGDAEYAEEELREAMETVTEIFGKKIGAEIASELDNLDADDRKELRHELRKVFHRGDFHISSDDSGGLGFPQFLIAMTAIILSLGLPVIILVWVLVYRNKKRKQKMELISSYLEAGQTVPEHVMAEFASDANNNSLFRGGVTFTIVGIAIAIFLGVAEDWQAATLGLIPIAIGVSRLISWKFDDTNDKS